MKYNKQKKRRRKNDSDYGYSYRQRRNKADWAGISLGDAFKANLDYYLRLPAQKRFYRFVRKAQQEVALLLGAATDDPKSKPQLGPCYTTYPATQAAYAAIGLSAFLEYRQLVESSFFSDYWRDYLKDPLSYDDLYVDPAQYKTLVAAVAKSVETRLLLEDLARSPALGAIELYRLFSAAQQTPRFETVPDIVNAVVLYGDVLPNFRDGELHATSQMIYAAVQDTSRPYFAWIAEDQGSMQPLIDTGLEWLQAIAQTIAHFMPDRDEVDCDEDLIVIESGDEIVVEEGSGQSHRDTADFKVPPLNKPRPPQLFKSQTPAQRLKNALADLGADPGKLSAPNGAVDQGLGKAIESLVKAVDQASGQQANFEDMRSDLIEHAMGNEIFAPSPIEGNPTDGNEVSVRLGDGESAEGEIFDRPAELDEDWDAWQDLIGRAQPIADQMRRALYPNIERVPHVERLCTSGQLDGSRLPLAGLSEAINRRYRIQEEADPRGRPLLVVACDGSSSLSQAQMQMVKILSAAWLSSTAKSDIQVLAALYHSGTVRKGISGPLVQWIYHPHKTPATTRAEAVRAVVGLPNSGTGAQSDALSLAFIMDQARQLARGRMVYLILISDCAWNRSFGGERDGEQEVQALFTSLYEDFGAKLHATLVALGIDGETGFEDQLDKVVPIADAELADSAAIAGKINLYVASCMRERSKIINVSGK